MYIIFVISAGGLATYLHVDYIVSTLIPENIPVHVIVDGGYVYNIFHTHSCNTQICREFYKRVNGLWMNFYVMNSTYMQCTKSISNKVK